MESRIEKWELSKADIDSIASDDLHEHRPNRWKGPKSTWRTWTEGERLLWQSMKRLEGQDLGVHLYNAHALKRMGRDPATAHDVTVTTDDGAEVVWAPPRSWTAWPLRLEQLPCEPFVERRGGGEEGWGEEEDDDGDDAFTFRRREVRYPSTDLREEITAAILRTARHRFRKRERRLQRRASNLMPSVEQPLVHPESAGGPGLPDRTKRPRDYDGADVDDEDMGCPAWGGDQVVRPLITAGMVSGGQKWHTEAGQIGFSTPDVSTNDELSSKLLSPSVGHILSRLDKTLLILHTLRASTVTYNTESSTNTSDSEGHSAAPRKPRGKTRSRSRQPQPQSQPTAISGGTGAGGGDGDGAQQQAEPQKRGKGRPRKNSRVGDTSASESVPLKTTKRGRPRKVHVPREGETRLQMMERVARESHRKLPDFIAADSAEDNEAAFEAWLSRGEEGIRQRRMSRETTADTETALTTDAEGGEAGREKRKRRRGGKHKLGLRDWSDVLGAAALAGFPPEVISRTAERCAALFGEAVVTRTLHEVPASRGTGVQTTTHHPSAAQQQQQQAQDSSDRSTSDDEPQALLQRRIASRQLSICSLASSPTGTPRRAIRSSTPGIAPGSRRTSRSPSAGGSHQQQQHFCPVAKCDRAARGFARRANLRRHMDLVHPGREADGDVDSEDEVVGGVHADGFLKPIAVGRGWRGEGVARRGRKVGGAASLPLGVRRGEEERGVGDDGDADDDDDDDDDGDDEAGEDGEEEEEEEEDIQLPA